MGHRTTLLQMRGELQQRVAAHTRTTPINRLPDVFDEAARNVQQTNEDAIKQKEALLLAEIEEALQRLDDGEFGLCKDCGGKIPDKRLAAIPWARYCVSCQEKVAPQ